MCDLRCTGGGTGRRSLPASRTGMWWCQNISQTLAAEHMTTFSGNDQSATLHDLWRKQQPANQNVGFDLLFRCVTDVFESHLAQVQTDGTADRPQSSPETETPTESSLLEGKDVGSMFHGKWWWLVKSCGNVAVIGQNWLKINSQGLAEFALMVAVNKRPRHSW